MKSRTLASVALLSTFAVNSHAGIYCENNIVDEGDSAASVKLKCGEPIHKESEATTCTFGIASAQCQTVQAWTYAFGPGRFTQTVIIEGGKVIAIRQGDKQ